jgi:hypothetical protein
MGVTGSPERWGWMREGHEPDETVYACFYHHLREEEFISARTPLTTARFCPGSSRAYTEEILDRARLP